MQVREGGKGGRSEGCGARGQIKKSRRVTMTPPCSINIIVSRAKKKTYMHFAQVRVHSRAQISRGSNVSSRLERLPLLLIHGGSRA